MLMSSPDIAHNCKIFLCSLFTPKTTGHFSFYFYHSEVLLSLVVIKRNIEILYNFEKLFGFGSGNGYPPEKREIERENKKILDKVRENNLKDLTDCLQGIDPELVKGALGGRHFKELFYANAKDPKIISYVKSVVGE